MLFGSQQVSMSGVVQAFEDLPDNDYADSGVPDEEDDEDIAPPPIKTVTPQKTVATPAARDSVQVKPSVQTKINADVAPQPQTKEKLDLSGIVVGCPVKHKAFGDGTVIEIDNGMITVAFGTAEKRFIFPTAFEQGFLKM